MNGFVVEDCYICPDCKGVLEDLKEQDEDIRKCKSCDKKYGIALFVKE